MNTSSSSVVTTAISVPDRYNCAITGDVMTMPVIACAEGHTFEMAAINEWRHSQRPNCHLCPTCRKPLLSTVIRNRDLQESIEGFLARVKAGYTGPSASVPPTTTTTAATTTATASAASNSSAISKTEIRAKVARLPSGKVSVSLQSDSISSDPLYFTLLFDSSGSMGTTNTVKTADGDVNISMMWLAQHCGRCIACLPGETAYLSIINFNSVCTKILPYTRLTEDGIIAVDRSLKPLEAGGTTNLFQALKTVEAAPGRQVTILLTDGQPDAIPGYPNFLEGIKTAQGVKGWPVFASTLHTIAFGNQLNSKVLQGLAAMSPGGRFFHSPSQNEIAPVILGLVAAELVHVSDGLDMVANFKNGTSARVKTGPLYSGQERILMLENVESVVIEGSMVPMASSADAGVTVRDDFMSLLSQCLAAYDQMGTKPTSVPEIERAMKAFHSRHSATAAAKDFLLDIVSADPNQGQLVLASKNMNTWGEPYLRAYLDGLTHCMPFNMMDPGLLGFMSMPMAETRKTLQIKMLDVEPWPLMKASSYGGYGSYVAPSAAATAAAVTTYMTGGGGCFAPGTPISIPGGLTKRIQDLKPGDLVMTPTGIATIRYVLQASTYDTTQPFCQITPGCLITEYHPIRNPITGKWRFPADDYPVLELPIPTVFNLVLDQGHIVLVEGIECCTLAHGFKGFVIGHPFFGTDRVIEAMSRQPGFDKGLPVYQNMKAIRDSATKMIVDWIDAV